MHKFMYMFKKNYIFIFFLFRTLCMFFYNNDNNNNNNMSYILFRYAAFNANIDDTVYCTPCLDLRVFAWAFCILILRICGHSGFMF